MRILWHSSSPAVNTGYGRVTREAVKRLRAAGHFVRVGTKHSENKWSVLPDGLEVFEGTDIHLVNQMLDAEGFDWLVSLWDIWVLNGKKQFPKEKWIAYVPINTEELPSDYKDVLSNTSGIWAQTRFGQSAMKRAGFESAYVPHGIDTQAFRPDAEAGEKIRKECGWGPENFVIGTIGLNYGDDTKGFIPLLLAFKAFHDAHPEARLFMGTLANERGVVSQSINYWHLVQTLGLAGVVAFPEQSDYFLGRTTDDDIRGWYNAMDVFVLASKGESFGLPIIEAQACGTPVIVPDWTSGPELCGAGSLIALDRMDDALWTPSGVWRYYPRPSRILEKFEEAFIDRSGDEWREIKSSAREFAAGFGWDEVWPKYWKPAIDEMERRLSERNKSE